MSFLLQEFAGYNQKKSWGDRYYGDRGLGESCVELGKFHPKLAVSNGDSRRDLGSYKETT